MRLLMEGKGGLISSPLMISSPVSPFFFFFFKIGGSYILGQARLAYELDFLDTLKALPFRFGAHPSRCF